jgi:hypothetical protein
MWLNWETYLRDWAKVSVVLTIAIAMNKVIIFFMSFIFCAKYQVSRCLHSGNDSISFGFFVPSTKYQEELD